MNRCLFSPFFFFVLFFNNHGAYATFQPVTFHAAPTPPSHIQTLLAGVWVCTTTLIPKLDLDFGTCSTPLLSTSPNPNCKLPWKDQAGFSHIIL